MPDTDDLEVLTPTDVRQLLQELEQQYGMASDAFYTLWQQGNTPIDGIDKLRWVSYYEASLIECPACLGTGVDTQNFTVDTFLRCKQCEGTGRYIGD